MMLTWQILQAQQQQQQGKLQVQQAVLLPAATTCTLHSSPCKSQVGAVLKL
jgi:hypothetical protein